MPPRLLTSSAHILAERLSLVPTVEAGPDMGATSTISQVGSACAAALVARPSELAPHTIDARSGEYLIMDCPPNYVCFVG